jgi:hypothetical protein
MSNYTKATNFASKDALSTGNPAKVIKGTEIDAEYTAIASAISSKADSNSPTFTGTPLAPTASVGTNTTQIATTAFVLANSIPSGMIAMWSGSVATIPSGWYLCNGSNGTPDLRDRFVVGAGSTYAVGASGGSANAVVVSHTHSASVTDPGHTHGNVMLLPTGTARFVLTGNTSVGENVTNGLGDNTTGNVTNSNTTGLTVTNASAGVSGTNANLPPYYALAYIMKA